MNFDLTAISLDRILAILALLSSFYVAYSARKKVDADIHGLAIEAATKSMALREKDVVALERDIDALIAKNEHLRDYIDYLWRWIKSTKTRSVRPKALEEFAEAKKSI
jgi:hypothetical protein